MIQKKAFLFSFGCKINRYEIEHFRAILSEPGFNFTNKLINADLIIINTCAVTAKAERKVKRFVRKAISLNPSAFLIITGCMAQMDPAKFTVVEGVDLVLGNLEKEDLKIFIQRFFSPEKSPIPFTFVNRRFIENNYHFQDHLIDQFHDRTRPFVKIQDGCEQFCSYCVIPYLRGRYRNRNFDNVVDQVLHFENQGYREVVLTGIHIGKYQIDNQPGLVYLLEALLKKTSDIRIRLSSLESKEISNDLIDLMVSNHRLCNHLHIPLQSGSNKILKKMNRNYDTEFYYELIVKLADKIKDIGIGLDVITGFPGETEEDFIETYDFIKILPPCYLHVFSYSDRPMTKATEYTPKVPLEVIHERSELLSALGKFKRQSFYNEFVEQKLNVLAESKEVINGFQKGLTSNYIKVFFPGEKIYYNEFVDVKIEYIDPNGKVIGRLDDI